MVLRVVEIKNNDLFAIYDAEKGGVCCCSKYTMSQLINEFGQKIEGVTYVGKKMIVKELSLDGKERTKKSPVICSDETKRSAVTILKGLDEKHYPRTKTERRTTGSLVKLTYTLNKKDIINDALAIRVAQGIFILHDFSMVLKEKHPELKVVNYPEATKAETTHMAFIKSQYDKKQLICVEQKRKAQEYEKRKAALEKEMAELQAQINLARETTEKKIKEIDAETAKIIIDKKYEGITGNELVSYSFTGDEEGPVISSEAIPYLIERTKRKILYTDGISYRHPSTYRKPISKTEALKIIKDSWFTLDATSPDYIHINTYSCNDMW